VVLFYFQHDVQKKAIEVVRSFIKQLVYQLDPIPEQIVEAWEDSENRGSSSTLKYFVDRFISCAGRFSKVFLFLDAFDECLDETERKNVIEFLKKLPKCESTCYTYITTRPHLLPEFEALEEPIFLEIKARNHDIEQSLTKRLISSDPKVSADNQKYLLELICPGAKGQYNFLIYLFTNKS
jgi:ankyrin repeat domain-containing protein 50